jgi:hypothetical protein
MIDEARRRINAETAPAAASRRALALGQRGADKSAAWLTTQSLKSRQQTSDQPRLPPS